MVVLEQSAESLGDHDLIGGRASTLCRSDQLVAEALVRPFDLEERGNRLRSRWPCPNRIILSRHSDLTDKTQRSA